MSMHSEKSTQHHQSDNDLSRMKNMSPTHLQSQSQQAPPMSLYPYHYPPPPPLPPPPPPPPPYYTTSPPPLFPVSDPHTPLQQQQQQQPPTNNYNYNYNYEYDYHYDYNYYNFHYDYYNDYHPPPPPPPLPSIYYESSQLPLNSCVQSNNTIIAKNKSQQRQQHKQQQQIKQNKEEKDNKTTPSTFHASKKTFTKSAHQKMPLQNNPPIPPHTTPSPNPHLKQQQTTETTFNLHGTSHPDKDDQTTPNSNSSQAKLNQNQNNHTPAKNTPARSYPNMSLTLPASQQQLYPQFSEYRNCPVQKICAETNNVLKTFGDAGDAAKAAGCRRYMIIRACKPPHKMCKRFKWRFASAKEALMSINHQSTKPKIPSFGKNSTQHVVQKQNPCPPPQKTFKTSNTTDNAQAPSKSKNKNKQQTLKQPMVPRRNNKPSKMVPRRNNKPSKTSLGKKLKFVNRPVQQICKATGKVLSTFSSVRQASQLVRGHKGSIILCCRGYRKSSSGYIWQFADSIQQQQQQHDEHLDDEDVLPDNSTSWSSSLSSSLSNNNKIQKICKETGAVLETFATINQAVMSCRSPASSIIFAIYGIRPTAGGYRWKYIDSSLSSPHEESEN